MYQQSETFSQVYQKDNYRVLTRLENDMLTIAIAKGENKNWMYCYIPKKDLDMNQSWNLKELRRHIQQSKNLKFSQEEMSMSVMMKTPAFGRNLNLQIIKAKMIYNQNENQYKLNRVHQNVQEKQKKAIIVVGKMSHGKSSFINTLILPKNTIVGDQISDQMRRKLLVTGANLKSITTESVLVQVNESHNLLEGQKLYAIDTPGLNSEDAICLILQQIDNIIIQKKCQIVGIAYVINLSADRQIKGNNTSNLKQFMKLLKMRKQLKNKLIFFILSNWDVLLFKSEQKEIQKCQNDFNKLVKEVGIPSHSSRIIKWASPFCSASKAFKIFLQQFGGNLIIRDQWNHLRKMIKYCSQSPLSLKQHTESMNIFWKKLIDSILSEVQSKNVKFKKESQIVDFGFQRYIQFGEKIGDAFMQIGQIGLNGLGITLIGSLLPESLIGTAIIVSGGTLTGISIIALPIATYAYFYRKKQQIKQIPNIKLISINSFKPNNENKTHRINKIKNKNLYNKKNSIKHLNYKQQNNCKTNQRYPKNLTT